ncbi:nitrate reductase molybdenum cofactor assembly chaperone [Bacillus sp. JJ1764]|uniref:nitrate reductase molybdenum cofactor assembly chaperone n=1 Tax=Bacillus sp. JJ1764 TaxID=3122964 RepID=UPI0030004FF7
MDKHQHIFGMASILLQHPEQDWLMDDLLLNEINSIDHQLVKLLFKQFHHYLKSTSYVDLCAEYAQTFDFNEKTTLYLTYSIFGDNPDRGKALLKLKNEFKEAGYPLDSNELPDYFPLILEFCSLVPIDIMTKMITIHKRSIDQLLKELSFKESPYQLIVQGCVQIMDHIIAKQKAS